MSRYGLTLPEFRALLEGQEGRCAICRVELAGRAREMDSPQVDHDHVSGKVRGILCRRCNTALGILRDDADVLARALAYLTAP